MDLKYDPVRTLPVARFYYGNRPVRRTVLVIESTARYIKGYELRRGNITVPASMAPIRTFTRSRIATFGDLRKDNKQRRRNRLGTTTLTRSGLLDLVVSGT